MLNKTITFWNGIQRIKKKKVPQKPLVGMLRESCQAFDTLQP
jgi:hypothetical protein